jgi:hypothetical protein
MSNRLQIHRANIKEAFLNPDKVLARLFEGQGMGDIWHGESPFFGADGESPAGFLGRVDDIVTVPGVRGLTTDGQSVNEIWNEMQMMLAAFNQSAAALAAFLSFRTVQERERVGIPVSPGFQVATEFGRPSKIRVMHVTRGFPLEHYDIGDGYTQEYIDNATGAQLLAIQATVVSDWTQLQREIVLDAVFNDTNYTDKDQIAVKVLYNNDGEVPPKIKRWTHDGTHTHYLESAGAALVQADLDVMSEHLIHHGFREFGDSAFILHAHRDDVATIRTFANWIPAETGERPQELANSGVIVGPTRGGAGLQVEGWVNDWTVVQNNDIPQAFLLGHVSGGPFDVRNVVGWRQHGNESARGLRLIEGNRQNYPLYDSVYDGYSGAGVGQRGAAVAMEITAGAYTPPTFELGS